MTLDIEKIRKEILGGSRISLAKAITLAESTRADHRSDAEELLSKLLKNSGKSVRIAISGPPGVGKSTFIEALGLHLLSEGKKIAVLAIDPSSPLTGGSILGDKTRMEELSKSENCFIRPSPSSGALGGVGRHTRETIILCEAAGFDIVLVETVGIGQSEFIADSMTDIFIQLHQPHSGDELQGIKKGVMELANLVVVTKADGDSKNAAELAKKDLERAISLTRGHSEDTAEVVAISSLAKTGIESAWEKIEKIVLARVQSGQIKKKRIKQTHDWLTQEIANSLQEMLEHHPRYDNLLKIACAHVEESNEHCGRVARSLVGSLLKPIE